MYTKELNIKNNTYLLCITKSGDIFFYKQETIIDEWSLEKETLLLDETIGHTSFALHVIRSIRKEIVHYIHKYQPPYLNIRANSCKKQALYKKLLFNLNLTGYKHYKDNEHLHLLKLS